MSAVISLAQAQSCQHAALCDSVLRLGGIPGAMAETGMGEDTLRRRLAGTYDWTGKEIAAFHFATHRQLGQSLIHERMGLLLTGAVVTAGDARRALGDVAATLSAVLAEAAIMADALKDGRIDLDEAREMLAQIPEVIAKLMQLQVDLMARLREG